MEVDDCPEMSPGGEQLGCDACKLLERVHGSLGGLEMHG